MTAKSRLIPSREIDRVITTLKALGVPIGPVDIRADGITVHPPAESPAGVSAYDRWKAKDQNRDPAAYP